MMAAQKNIFDRQDTEGAGFFLYSQKNISVVSRSLRPFLTFARPSRNAEQESEDDQ